MGHKPEGLHGVSEVDKGTLCRRASSPPGIRGLAKKQGKQKTSRSGSALEPAAVYGPPSPIAQIYFPTDGFKLDMQDRCILDNLCQEFIMLLDLGYNVAISITGGADQRGTDDYNMNLGSRRAKSVETYIRQNMPRSPKLSIHQHSIGEQPSDRRHFADQRRVDISLLKTRKVSFEPDVIHSDKVKRPVQFIWIEFIPTTGDGKGSFDSIKYLIIVEKSEMILKTHTLAYDMHQRGYWYHRKPGLFSPQIVVSRNTIKWRKPKTSDTVKNIGKGTLDYILGVMGLPKGDIYDPDVGESHAKLRLGFYKSWKDYEARGSGEFLIYKNK